MSVSGNNVVIVGAGFSGLASAALLAHKGFSVLVLEKNSAPGGRAMLCARDGFRFDMGPSWYLMPDIFERFFAAFGTRPADFYELKRLDPSYRIFFGPDDWVDISSDFDKNLDLFERLEAGAGEKLREYVQVASHQYDAAVGEFLYKDYRSLLDFFTRRTLMEGRKLHVFESIDRYARRYFRSERLRRILRVQHGLPGRLSEQYSCDVLTPFSRGFQPGSVVSGWWHGVCRESTSKAGGVLWRRYSLRPRG